MRGALRDVFDVLIDAGRLLARHWPVALTLAMLGMAWRGATLWAAVAVSDWNGLLGRSLLILAPLGFLVPLVLLLRRFRADLPHVARLTEAGATTGDSRRLLDIATSVLVPFLTVYVSYGFLQHDLDHFRNSAGVAEANQEVVGVIYGDVSRVDWHRVFVPQWQVLLLIVAGAWLARFVLGKAEKRLRWVALAVVGALVETYWTSNVAGFIQESERQIGGWLGSRVVVHRTTEGYDAVVGALGPLAHPVDTVTTWLWSLLGSFDAVVVVPLAWLTVAAVVLGHTLAPPPKPEHPVIARVQRRMPEVGRRALGGVADVFDDVRSRFAGLVGGLRQLAAAGILPMLLFALAFLVSLRIPWLVSAAWRWLVGPQPFATFDAFANVEYGLGNAVAMVVLAVLLGAAIDRLVMPTITTADPDPRADSAAAPTTA